MVAKPYRMEDLSRALTEVITGTTMPPTDPVSGVS